MGTADKRKTLLRLDNKVPKSVSGGKLLA